jgi:hypothetical protein
MCERRGSRKRVGIFASQCDARSARARCSARSEPSSALHSSLLLASALCFSSNKQLSPVTHSPARLAALGWRRRMRERVRRRGREEGGQERVGERTREEGWGGERVRERERESEGARGQDDSTALSCSLLPCPALSCPVLPSTTLYACPLLLPWRLHGTRTRHCASSASPRKNGLADGGRTRCEAFRTRVPDESGMQAVIGQNIY